MQTRESLRARLEARAAELDAPSPAGDVGAGVVTLDQQRVGRLSRQDALQAQAMAQATQARHARERRRVRQALARIDRDDYGCCAACDQPIPIERLEIDPSLEYCVDCAGSASS